MKNFLFTLLLCSPLIAADKPRIVRWSLGAPGCTVMYLQGLGYEAVYDQGRVVSAWAPIKRDKNTLVVKVGVYNMTKDELIDVNPDDMGARSDEMPPTLMNTVDAMQKIAKEERSERRRAAIGAAFGGFAAGYNANTTATATNSDGSTTTLTVHDPNASREANQDAALNRAAIAVRAQGKMVWILQRNTVTPNNSAIGDVFVERPKNMGKKAQIGEFGVRLGKTVYIFPYVNGAIPTK